MTEQKTNKVTTVEILGSEYSLVGEDESYLKKLAQYVDSEFRTCSEEGTMYSKGQLGILTCLNIADQFYKLKNEYRELALQTLGSITKLINKIDKILVNTKQDSMTVKAETMLEEVSAKV